MDYRNAAGRNWARQRPRRRRLKLGEATAAMRLPETLPAPGQLEHRDAAGRNWARQRPERRRVELPSRPRPDYPAREAGGGDHDVPYEFRPPTAAWTFPFTSRQFARLLVLRGRVRDGAFADDLAAPGQPLRRSA